MSDMLSDDLYREIILDHYTNPRNMGHCDCATHHLEGHNASCGDTIEMELIIKDGKVQDVKYDGQGCSISMASASMLSEAVKGKTLEEAQKITDAFKARLLSKDAPAGTENVDLGELEALDGVKDYPVRIKCALLCWETLQDGLNHPEGLNHLL